MERKRTQKQCHGNSDHSLVSADIRCCVLTLYIIIRSFDPHLAKDYNVNGLDFDGHNFRDENYEENLICQYVIDKSHM